MADSVQYMMDTANQDTRKGKNFFALDENETVNSSLRENDSFKFLSKITKDEGLFSEFINNINYRGTYQMLESIRIIVRDYEANIFSLIKMKRMLTGVSKIAGASDTLVTSSDRRLPSNTSPTLSVKSSIVTDVLPLSTTSKTTSFGHLQEFLPRYTEFRTKTE